MKIKKNHSLKKYNTFRTDVKAKYFAKIKDIQQLKEILQKYPNEKILLLGDGSNTLLVDDWDGLTLKVEFKGKEILRESKEKVEIKIASGENWDKFVRYCVSQSLAGVESLPMIPGTIGAAVAQNIGAYGQEVVDTLVSIEAIEIPSLELKTFLPKDSGFRYRNTYFKNEWRGKYVITSATFKLRKYGGRAGEYHQKFEEKGQYEGLKEELKSFAQKPYSIRDVMEAVIKQRKKKLPSLKVFGTCGSFFENPIIKKEKYEKLKLKIHDLPSYPVNGNLVKIPAGKLLDELGWKGKWSGNVGVSEKHALCVISNKKATGREIYEFTQKMQKDIKNNYGIKLESEVNIILN